MKSNISEQTNYLQSKFTIIYPQNYKMSPLRGVTLAGLAKKYSKNGGVRKANFDVSSEDSHVLSDFTNLTGYDWKRRNT